MGTLQIRSFELGFFEVRRFYIHFGGMQILQTFLADFLLGLPAVIQLHDFFLTLIQVTQGIASRTCLCLILPYDLTLGFTVNNEAASAVAEGWWWLWGLACLNFLTAAPLA